MTQALFPERHPYRAASLLFAVAVIVFLVVGTAVTLLELAPWSLQIISFVLLSGVCFTLLAKNRWWSAIGLRPPYQRRLLWLFWLPFVPVIGNLLDGVQSTDSAQILLFLVMALLSGFVEEILFRGLILRALLPTGIWRAALISAALFGSMHILNVLTMSNPIYALLQVGYAAAIGFAYAALVIRTGTLWPLILAHCLTNFAGFMAANGAGLAGPVAMREFIFAAAYIALFSAYGIYLLRQLPPNKRDTRSILNSSGRQ